MKQIHNNKRLLQDYVLLRLSEDDEFEIQEHLINCEECSTYVHQLRLTSQKNILLHKKLIERKKVQKLFPSFRNWKIAASVIILVGFGYGLSEFSNNNVNKQQTALLKKDTTELNREIKELFNMKNLLMEENKQKPKEVTVWKTSNQIIKTKPNEIGATDKFKSSSIAPVSSAGEISPFSNIVRAHLVGLVNIPVYSIDDTLVFINDSRQYAVWLTILNAEIPEINNNPYEILKSNELRIPCQNIGSGAFLYKILDKDDGFIQEGKFIILSEGFINHTE